MPVGTNGSPEEHLRSAGATTSGCSAYSWSGTLEVVVTSADAGQMPHSAGHDDLVPLDQLIRDTPGAHPITSIGELRNGAFETDEELDAFLAFVTESRHADLA